MKLKKLLPHAVALAVFVCITLVFFSPMLSGKKLKQGDTNNWLGAAKELIDYRDQHHAEALWTNSMFGGMPAYQISVVYGANLMRYVDKVVTLGLPAPSNFLFLYMAGFYFLLLAMGVNQRVAVLGALAYAFSSYFIVVIEGGHNTKAQAIAYMAPVVAGTVLAYRGRLLAGGAVMALALALELFANHLQVTYYLMLALLLYVVAEGIHAVRSRTLPAFIRSSAVLAGAALLAVLPNITNLVATEEYGKYSTRGPSELKLNSDIQTTGLDKDYITDWSYGVGESWTFLVPNFKGGASQPIAQDNRDVLKKVDPNYRQNIAGYYQYFGEQSFTQGTVYAGAVVCLLFLLGAVLVRGRVKWWLLAASVLSFTLSWGKNMMWLTDIFLDFVPGYDKFRAVTIILVIAELTFPLLGALALDRIIRSSDLFPQRRKAILWVMGSLLGITLLMAAAPDLFTSFYTTTEYDAMLSQAQQQQVGRDVVDAFFSNVEIARKAIFVNDALRSFFFILLASAAIWTFLKYRYKSDYLVYGLMVLVLADMWGVGRRYIDKDNFGSKSAIANPFPETNADRIIDADTSGYRVLNLAVSTFNDASTSYRHQSIGGYHGAKLKRYKELIDSCLTPELVAIRMSFSGGDSAVRQAIASQPALNMLNAKYVIYNPEAPPLLNTGALGNAWFVREAKVVADANEEIGAVNRIDPAVTAVVDQRFKDQLSGFSPAADSAASIRLTSYQPNQLVYAYSSAVPQLTVFSEIYYDKGWKATVDGKEAPYFRADYVLRAMVLPAGTHTVEFRFEPAVYAVGEKVAMAGSVVILVLAALALVSGLRKAGGTA
jgi:hypothetical protein